MNGSKRPFARTVAGATLEDECHIALLGHAQVRVRRPTTEDISDAVPDNGFLVSFPYVCPEPVLAK
jgi:hypothetical protein